MPSTVRLQTGRALDRLDVLGTLAVGQSPTAPNFVEVRGGPLGAGPILEAKGPNANVPLVLASKADAPIHLRSNGRLAGEFVAPSNAVNALSISGSAAGQPVAIRTVGSDADRGILISPGGTASLTVAGPATFQGAVTLPGAPTLPNHAATRAYVDAVAIGATGIDLSAYLQKAGGTMTGPLVLSGTPTLSGQAVTKGYVDTLVASIDPSLFVLKSGSTMTGFLTLAAGPTTNFHAATKKYVDDTVAAIDFTPYLARAGGTMTGFITLNAAPTSDLHAATKKYVDDRDLTAGGTVTGNLTLSGTGYLALPTGTTAQRPGSPALGYIRANSDNNRVEFYAGSGWREVVRRDGDTMTGLLTLSAGPSSDLHAATKKYVDDTVAGATYLATSITDFNSAANQAARAAIPWEWSAYVRGTPAANQVVVHYRMPGPVRFAANLSGSYFDAYTAATASTVISVAKNGTQFATITVGATGTTGTIAGTLTDFAAGDLLTVTCPASPDATFGDFGITLVATRL